MSDTQPLVARNETIRNGVGDTQRFPECDAFAKATPSIEVSFFGRVAKVLRAFLWPKEEIIDFHFNDEEIGAVYRAMHTSDEPVIDDQTWRDLDLSSYSSAVGAETSIFGQQLLHRRLRCGSSDFGAHDAQAKYTTLVSAVDEVNAIVDTLRPLRKLDVEVSALAFNDIPGRTPWWVKWLWTYRVLGFLAIGGALTSAGWMIVLVLVVCTFFLLQLSWHNHIENFDRKLVSLRIMLKVSHDLGLLAKKTASPLLKEFLNAVDEVSQLSSRLTRSRFETSIPGLVMYMDWFLLSNIKHHFRSVDALQTTQQTVRGCYLRLANLEADIAIARHIREVGLVAWAARGEADVIVLEDVVNPLLRSAVPVSIFLDGKGVFISGQNGSGKSTFLRTAGINLAVGRAFGFCYAARALIPGLPIYTSIQVEDSMVGGESLYIAELRRARELIQSTEGGKCGTYIIDEIFRGTNHIESVSAAAAVVDALAKRALVIVSSHNLVLAAVLGERLEKLRVESAPGSINGIKLVPGILERPNGIALLTSTGFSADVAINASAVASWLAGYLAHPNECPDILNTAVRGAPD